VKLIFLAAVFLLFASTAAAADGTVSACGKLEGLQRPNALDGVAGSATIAGRLYEFGPVWSNAPGNTISRYASVGGHVCLTGQLNAQTNTLSAYVIGACGDRLGTSGCPAVEGAGDTPALPINFLLLAFGAGLITLLITGWYQGRQLADA
jgi:hypothetical protein